MKIARWEIVRTAAGWHLRFKAANHRILVTSEVYTEERGARRALEAVIDGNAQGHWTHSRATRWPIVVIDERPSQREVAP